MSSCLFVDANLGAPRVCVVACKRTVAVVVAVEVAVPVAVAGAEPRSSSRSGTSRAAIHCGLSGFGIFGVFGVWMFWTSVVEFGSPNMFWILVLSSCVGSWTSHSALELGFLILFWNLVLSARIFPKTSSGCSPTMLANHRRLLVTVLARHFVVRRHRPLLLFGSTAVGIQNFPAALHAILYGS